MRVAAKRQSARLSAKTVAAIHSAAVRRPDGRVEARGHRDQYRCAKGVLHLGRPGWMRRYLTRAQSLQNGTLS
jgi:hypothetical protein